MKLNKMNCQQCTGIKNLKNGCSSCGGYGHVLEELKHCAKCDLKAWFRPGGFTNYDGKIFRSFDGLRFVTKNGKSLCEYCDTDACG